MKTMAGDNCNLSEFSLLIGQARLHQIFVQGFCMPTHDNSRQQNFTGHFRAAKRMQNKNGKDLFERNLLILYCVIGISFV